MGGRSLTISVVIHALLLIAGLFWVLQISPQKKKAPVDFIASGGGGGSPASSEVKNKKRNMSLQSNAPRMAAVGAESKFALPEPDTSSEMSSLGALGGGFSGGLGGDGSGGGRGNGNGKGFGNGGGPGLGGGKPFAGVVFGNPVKARNIGAVLDVSPSMTPHLTEVIKELDRVAEGSPLILYVGCGVGEGRPRGRSYSTMDINPKRFERFWRLNHDRAYLPNKTLEQGSAKIKVDFSTPIPAEPLFRLLASRPNTFYLDFEGVQFAWAALLSKELEEVEAVYWFADFQDGVNEKEAGSVMKKMGAKRQKLYVHASASGGHLSKVRDLMVIPTGGSVISTK